MNRFFDPRQRPTHNVGRFLLLVLGSLIVLGLSACNPDDSNLNSIVALVDPVPSGSISPSVWDVTDDRWENGNPRGYAEGDTAAMAVKISNEAGNTYVADFCLQSWEDPFTDAYGFSAFEAWNASLTPPTLPNGPVVDGQYLPPWDTSQSFVWGYNITIDDVSMPVIGDPTAIDHPNSCADNYLGVRVTFTVNSDSDAYIVWGGHLAAPGDPLPVGAPDNSVPDGEGASQMTGVFQSRIEGSGAKTINFKGSDILERPDLLLSKTVTLTDNACPGEPTLSIPTGNLVKYCFVISNSGSAPLLNVTLTDPTLGGDLTGLLTGDLIDADGNGENNDLDTGGTATAELVSQPITMTTTNVATATGSDLSQDDNATVLVYEVDVEVDKKVSDDGLTFVDERIELLPGASVWWQTVIVNNSPAGVDISLFDVLDDQVIDLDFACEEQPVPSELAANGGTYTCTIGPQEAQAGVITNTFTVEACDQVFPEACDTAQDAASYEAASINIALVKEISSTGGPPWQNEIEVLVGSPLYYLFTVRNSGERPLVNVIVTDPLLGTPSDGTICAIGDLAVGETKTCQIGPIPASFTGKQTPQQNVAKATGCFEEACVEATDDAYFTGLYWSFPPDFWKKHSNAKGNAWLTTDYRPRTPVCKVFAAACTYNHVTKKTTLYQALCFPEDGMPSEQLLRQGVTALLNASYHEKKHGDIFGPDGLIYFPLYSTYEACMARSHTQAFCQSSNVVDLVDTALAGDEQGMIALAEQLASINDGLSDP